MLLGKKTLLKLHETQKSASHVYFEYDAFEEVGGPTEYEYRVGYYLPMSDWLCLGSPEEVTVSVQAGNQMESSLNDEGNWGGDDEDLNKDFDIDQNIPMDVSVRHQVQEELAQEDTNNA